MEVTAFVIGLNEVIGIYDNVCRIWKTISEARDFGADMADFLARLEMQFFKYDMWWQYAKGRAVLRQRIDSSGTESKPGTGQAPGFHEQLRYASGKPIENAAASVERLLKDIQKVLAEYQVLNISSEIDQQSLSNKHTHIKDQPNVASIQAGMDEAASHHKTLITSLQKKTPWYKRVKAGSAPWKTTDKDGMEDRLAKFTGWNDNLYSLLPSEVRESVLRQGLGAYLFESDEIDSKQIAGLQQSKDDCELEIGNSARLFKIRRQFEEKQPADSNLSARLKDKELNIDDLTVVEDAGSRSVGLYGAEEQEQVKVLVEWYNYGKYTVEEKAIAFQRLKQLSFIFGEPDKPSTLHVCDSLGVLEDEDRSAFGLVTQYPSNTLWPYEALSFRTILRDKTIKFPPLEQRRRLAQRIASALFALMVLRWFHKNFNAFNILFFFDHKAQKPDLEYPYIFGFDIARPDRPKEVSINTTLEKGVAIYHHSEVRSGTAKEKGYQKKYEIFALGIVLAEIGFWETVENLVPGAADLAADKLAQRITDKCQTELGFFMGERYRDIAVMCLTVPSQGGLAESLAEFYGRVVRDLIDRRV